MKKLSILIVDDAPDVCSLLAHWLRAHHTACVYSGADALTAVTLLHFDLVITDIHMPDISGFDVIRRLKETQPWVKVLAISGGSRYLSAAAGIAQATDIGVDGVILKPFDEERLLTRVKACWETPSEHSPQFSQATEISA
jgi:two-component system, OmpR family, response regulator